MTSYVFKHATMPLHLVHDTQLSRNSVGSDSADCIYNTSTGHLMHKLRRNVKDAVTEIYSLCFDSTNSWLVASSNQSVVYIDLFTQTREQHAIATCTVLSACHFLLYAYDCGLWKRLSNDHCCRNRWYDLPSSLRPRAVRNGVQDRPAR